MDTAYVKIVDLINTLDPTPIWKQGSFWLSIVSLLIAFSAIAWPTFKESRKSKKKESLLHQNLIQILKLGEMQITKRISYYKNLVHEISEEKSQNFSFVLSSTMFQTSIERMDINTIFSIILSRKNEQASENYFDLFHVVDSLKNEETSFLKYFHEFKIRYKEVSEPFLRDAFEGYCYAKEKLNEVKKTHTHIDEFYTKLEELFSNFHGEFEDFESVCELARKTVNLCKNNSKRSDAKYIKRFFRGYNKSLRERTSIKESYIETLNREVAELEECNKKVKKILEYIKI